MIEGPFVRVGYKRDDLWLYNFVIFLGKACFDFDMWDQELFFYKLVVEPGRFKQLVVLFVFLCYCSVDLPVLFVNEPAWIFE